MKRKWGRGKRTGDAPAAHCTWHSELRSALIKNPVARKTAAHIHRERERTHTVTPACSERCLPTVFDYKAMSGAQQMAGEGGVRVVESRGVEGEWWQLLVIWIRLAIRSSKRSGKKQRWRNQIEQQAKRNEGNDGEKKNITMQFARQRMTIRRENKGRREKRSAIGLINSKISCNYRMVTVWNRKWQLTSYNEKRVPSIGKAIDWVSKLVKLHLQSKEWVKKYLLGEQSRSQTNE